MLKHWLPWIIIALLGLGPLVVCALIGPLEMGSDLGQKAGPDWSRAVKVGSDSYGTDSGAPLVVDDEKRVHLVWSLRHNAQRYDLRYVRLDQQGSVDEEHDLGLDLFQPRSVLLVLGSDGAMHLFLLAYSEQGANSGLYHITLSADGQVRAGPTLVSSAANQCFEYDLAVTSADRVHLFWTEGAGTERDLFYQALDLQSSGSASPRVVARGVSHPVAAVGPSAILHVFWEERGTDEDSAALYYARVEGEVPGSLSGRRMVDLLSGKKFFRVGPVVTFDDKYAYLVWTVEYRQDMAAPAISEGWYGAFSLDSPSTVSARPFSLPIDEKPTYTGHDSPFRYEYLVAASGNAEYGSERLTYPSALDGYQEAIVTCGMTMLRGVSLEHQIVNLVFGEGALLGYQVAGNTTHWSRLSNVYVDIDGDLHLSWVDGLEPGPSDVYYSTTARSVRARVDGLTGDDILLAVFSTGFSAVAGAPAIPLAVSWMVAPLIWVLIAGFFMGSQGARSARGYVALAVAVVVYEASKLYFSPALLDYVPFSVSIPFLSVGLYAPLRVLVPVAIVCVGTLGALYALFRAETRSLLVVSLVFILVDAVLTVIIYGSSLALMA